MMFWLMELSSYTLSLDIKGMAVREEQILHYVSHKYELWTLIRGSLKAQPSPTAFILTVGKQAAIVLHACTANIDIREILV
jgi:hypothetical protein